MRERIWTLCATTLLLSGPLTAQAGPYDAIYAFGDSLSDVGNIYALTAGTEPAAPYVNGQFSNGPVWLQTFAAGVGLAPLTPSILGGTDFAYGGAETGTTPFHTGNPTDLTGAGGQLAQFQLATHSVADPNALYTIWIGSNDMRSASTAGGTAAQVSADIGAAVGNVDSVITTLASEGARNFLIVTVPDLGKTPEALAAGSIAAVGASRLAAAFDSTLVNGSGPIPSLMALASGDGLNLRVLDTYTLLDNLVANGSAYGFSDVTDACLTGSGNYAGGTLCSATVAGQDQYLFWDQIHPTAAGHALIGTDAIAAVAAQSTTVPEPAALSLLGIALAGFGILRRRRAG